MPSFGTQSKRILAEVHPDLRSVFDVVIQIVDCAPVPGGGVRTPAQQRRLVAEGRSETLHSKHLPSEDGLSRAIDVAPYPVEWPDKTDVKRRAKATARFYLFAGVVLGVAHQMGIRLRWGGDWDGDWDLFDQKFDDLVHFELVEP